jgi:recombination protein RecA
MKRRIMRKAITESRIDEIADAMAQVLGKDVAHRASYSVLGKPRFWIPSGVPSLDRVLDREGRGWPGGRIIEIYGGPATCKTGVGYALVAQVQKKGGDAILYPVEGEFDEWLADRYGVNLKRLLIVEEPEQLVCEAIFESWRKAIRLLGRRGMLLGMIDSVASMSTRAEFEDEKFDRDRAAQIRAMQISKAMRKIAPLVASSNAILFCVNQTRESTDSTPSKPKPPGGQALKFHASVRLRLEVIKKLHRTRKGRKYVAGFFLKITAEKNRLAQPFQEAHVLLDFERGLLPLPKKRKRKQG